MSLDAARAELEAALDHARRALASLYDLGEEFDRLACSTHVVDESAGLRDELEPGRTEAEYFAELDRPRTPEPDRERSHPGATKGDGS